MHKFAKLAGVVWTLLLVFQEFQAQVVVNEFCFANYSDFTISGENEDWVEFYNPGSSAFNIGGYWLSDNAANPQKWQIPAGTTVPAGGFLLILVSGTGEYDPGYLGEMNTNFKVTQTAGEEIVFSNTSGTILESYDFDVISPNQANHSWGRSANGGPDWVIFTNPSPEGSNSGLSGVSYAATPGFNQQAGYYSGSISVSISSPDPAAVIYYTLDGSEPNNTDNLYSGPVSLNATTVLRAIAYSPDAGILPSFVATNTYFFGADQHSVYTVSISGNAIGDGSWWGDERCHLEVFAPQGTFLVEASGDSNEHGNDSNAYGQRGFDYITRDAMGYDNEVEYPLFGTSDRPSYERIIFKAAANDNYPFANGAHIRDAYVHQLSILGNLKLDERKTESCILYLNGDYWGVYEMREKVDDIDFTDYYFDQPEGFVDFLKTWGGTWEEYGDGADWYDLVNFITTNNMAVQANYEYVETQYNTHSLIDYFILNGYTVCTDWLNWNTAWWRGRHPQGDARRWRYALWDSDATFDHYINYTGVPSTSPTADPCQIDGMGDVGGQGHVPVLNALFDNDTFFADYIQRYAAHSNTIFSCDRMIEVLDSMINVIEPEMTRQCQRWGGSYNGWMQNVNQLRNFILERCNEEIIDGISDCYDVTPFTVTVVIQGEGEMEIQEIPLFTGDTPWSGVFFADLPIDLEAFVDDGGGACGAFGGWEIISGSGTVAEPDSAITTLTISSDVTLQVTFQSPSSGGITVMTDVVPAGAGTIQVNGIAQGSYPATGNFGAGEWIDLSATASEWYLFSGWQSIHADLEPSEDSPEVGFSSCVSDTVIAVFDWIPNYELTVLVFPPGAGTVAMDGAPLSPLPWTSVLAGDTDYQFVTEPSDIWSIFSHWEVNHHVLTPDEFSTSVWLHLMQQDTLIAVYDVIQNHSVTVRVEPPYAGVVHFAGNYSTDYEETVDLEANIPFDFNAIPQPYWLFRRWTSASGHAIAPGPLEKQVSMSFAVPDTVTAWFEQEPYAVYVPNAFTPNDDGLNDVFVPQGSALDPSDYHLMIFNRWGEKLFESTNPGEPWNGSHQGGSFYVEDGIYLYRLRVKSIHEPEPRELSGSVTLFR